MQARGLDPVHVKIAGQHLLGVGDSFGQGEIAHMIADLRELHHCQVTHILGRDDRFDRGQAT